MHEGLMEWSRWGWPLIGNHLWQATLVALAIAVAVSCFKRAPARIRHALWLVASIKLALPSFLFFYFIASLGISLPSLAHQDSSPIQSVAMIAQMAEPIAWQEEVSISTQVLDDSSPRPHNEIFCALTICWLIGCAGVLLVWWRKRRDFSRAMKAGKISTHGREAEAVARVRSWLRVHRRVDLVLTPRLTEPGVWRVCRPVLVLPESMSDLLTESELEAVIMHEMVHIARWDNLFSNFQMLLCCAFWFHPMVWLIDRRLLIERERACDEKVVELSGAAKVYASSLLKVLGFCLGWKVAGVSLATGSNLQRRIEQIMTGNKDNRFALSHRIVFGGVITAVILLSIAAGLLSRDQVIAQTTTSGQVPPRPPAAPPAPELSPLPELQPPSAPSPLSAVEAPALRGTPPTAPTAPTAPVALLSRLSPLTPPAPMTPVVTPAIRPPAPPVAAIEPMAPMAPQKDKKEKEKDKKDKKDKKDGPDSSIIKKVPPEYPDNAKAANVTGEVQVEVVIDEKGDVISAKAVSGPDLLKSAAVDAARQWKFKPMKISSKPVKVAATLTFDFKL